MAIQPSSPLSPPNTRLLWSLAWPAAISVVLNNAFRVVDQYSVQWIDADAQAAIGSNTFVLIVFFAVYELIAAGTGPLIARATGAKDHALRRQVLGTSMTGVMVLGVLVSVICVLGAEDLSAALGLSGQALERSTVYLTHLGYAGLPLAFSPVMDAAFIALGRTRLVMGLHGISVSLNLALNFLFIYGFGWGIAGAAWASGLSRALVLIPGIWWLWREIKPTRADWFLRAPLIRILKVGAPIAVNTAAYALVYWGLLRWTISPLGPDINASLGIGFSALEGFTWPAFHGVSLAVASLVGRYLGAGEIAAAKRVARLAMPFSTGLGLGAAMIFYWGAKPLCGVFTADPAVLEAAILYAQVLAFSQVFVAWEALTEGVLAGSGDTRTVLIWSAPVNVLRIPIGYYLAFSLGWGAAGVWWAINWTTALKAFAKGMAVVRGRWAVVTV